MNIYSSPTLAFASGALTHYLYKTENQILAPRIKGAIQVLQSLDTIIPFANFVFSNYKYHKYITAGITMTTISVVALSAWTLETSLESKTLLITRETLMKLLLQAKNNERTTDSARAPDKSILSTHLIRMHLMLFTHELARFIHTHAGRFFWLLSISKNTVLCVEKGVKSSIKDALFTGLPLAWEAVTLLSNVVIRTNEVLTNTFRTIILRTTPSGTAHQLKLYQHELQQGLNQLNQLNSQKQKAVQRLNQLKQELKQLVEPDNKAASSTPVNSEL